MKVFTRKAYGPRTLVTVTNSDGKVVNVYWELTKRPEGTGGEK